jgi:hypothetical protein
MARSLLDLPLKARAAFFCAYLGVQIVVLIRAQRAPDFMFGFQMFNASSDMKITLLRQVRRKGRARLIPVKDGSWAAKGALRTFHWRDRVHDGVLGTLGSYVHASYGIEAQLYRLQFALADVAAHIPDDHETEALVAVVDTIKNGREDQQVRLRANRP